MSDFCKMLFDYFRRFSSETHFSIVHDAQTSPNGHHTPFAFSFLRFNCPSGTALCPGAPEFSHFLAFLFIEVVPKAFEFLLGDGSAPN